MSHFAGPLELRPFALEDATAVAPWLCGPGLSVPRGSAWPQRLEGVALVSIGPQTSNTCREVFGRVDAEADPHDLDGLVAACSAALEERSLRA